MHKVKRVRVFDLARALVFGSLSLLCVSSLAATSAQTASQQSQQLVLVITADWDANQGTLSTYERAGSRWQVRDRQVAVTIGRSGAAWGTGLHEPQTGLQKREGDGRSPAGMFAIERAFGYAPTFESALGYVAMTAADYCIDVSDSAHYNKIVTSASQVGPTIAALDRAHATRPPCEWRSPLRMGLRHRTQSESRARRWQLHLRACLGHHRVRRPRVARR